MKTREQIAERLAEIARKNDGRLTPEAVVADARDPESPLHDQFEWDVQKAAAAHWLDQARALIRSVRVVVHTETQRIESVAYVRDPTAEAGEQGYRAVLRIKSDRELAREAVVAEFVRARAALQRAREVAAVLEIGEEIEEQIDSIKRLHERVEGSALAQ